MNTLIKLLLWGALGVGFTQCLPYLNHEMRKVLVKRMKKGFTPLPNYADGLPMGTSKMYLQNL